MVQVSGVQLNCRHHEELRINVLYICLMTWVIYRAWRICCRALDNIREPLPANDKEAAAVAIALLQARMNEAQKSDLNYSLWARIGRQVKARIGDRKVLRLKLLSNAWAILLASCWHQRKARR